MAYDEAIWLEYRRHGYEALYQMLSQYRGEDEDRDNVVDALEADSEILNLMTVMTEKGEATASSLEGHKADWFRTLHSLAVLCESHLQYDEEYEGDLWHDFMTAGEWATAELHRYGFLTLHHTGGSWTQAGRELLEGNVTS